MFNYNRRIAPKTMGFDEYLEGPAWGLKILRN